MTAKAPSLSSLIGSRICHDLISPIGAITNGVELLGISGDATGPELALIDDSVAQAAARIKFFRVAFGLADASPVPQAEVAGILHGIEAGSRIQIAFAAQGEMPRDQVRLVFLAVLCVETALPFGGQVTITRHGGR